MLVDAREARTREHVEADARVHAHVGQTHVQVLPPQSMRTTGGAAKTVCNLGSMRSHGFYDNIANRAVEAHSPHCTLDPSIAGAWIRTDGALATSMIDKGVLWAQEPLSARRSPSIPPLALAVPDGLPPMASPRWPRSTVGADGHPLERRLCRLRPSRFPALDECPKIEACVCSETTDA